MAKPKKKKKRSKSRDGGGSKRSGSMSSLRGGMKSLVGQGQKRKESTASKVLTWILLVAAVGLLAYRFLL